MTQPTKNAPTSTEVHTENDIAVVGFSFKLPQNVNDVDGLWDVLEKRRNLMTPFPEDRMNSESFLAGERKKFSCHGGYFIDENPAEFDAPFFSISTKEAAVLDPMQRWTLETSYRAFENAGMPVEKLKGSRTAVFSASFTDDWSRMVAQDPENTGRTAATGTASSLIPNRLSWYFDLRGPSVHLDTACSSSLVALDMACQAIRAGDASAALVTGSSLILTPTYIQFLSDLGFLSADSKCWTFDRRANGYARGEGFVSMILKPVSAALRDGDMIRAVIRGSGANQDGQTPSLTQPSTKAQEELIRHVYRKANLSFDQTRYFEAHGTGTPVGDPIEMKAIGNVFRTSRSPEEPLYVGSLKTNIGHLEGSSGLAGIVKCIVSMEKGIIPPHALFEELNPDIDAEFYNITIPLKGTPWPTDGLRRVSVNSFGWGGANAHAVLDDAYHYLQERGLSGNHCTDVVPKLALTNGNAVNGNGEKANGAMNHHVNGHEADRVTANGVESKSTVVTNGSHQTNGVANAVGHSKARLLVWSAPDEKALRRTIDGQRAFYETQIAGNQAKVDQLAYTLAERRSRMLWRASAMTSTDDSSNAAMLSVPRPVRSSNEVGLAFVFTGQGAQYANMGRELVDEFPLFKKTLQSVGEMYRRLGCEWDLLEELRNEETINRPEYSQPLSTAVQIGLLELLKSFDMVPKAVVGHSSGEIAAAYAIGALSLESACKVSYFRGLLAGRLRDTSSSAGAMISVNLAEADVASYLDRMGISGVSVACINSPTNCTLSGPESAIDAIKKEADKESLFARKLTTGVAYHSSAMLAIADEYKQLMGDLEGGKSQSRIRMISTVTGQTARRDVLATPQYWVDNMVSPVRFAEAIHGLTGTSSSISKGFLGSITDIIEVGPTAALRRPVLDSLAEAGPRSKQARYASVLQRGTPAVNTTLELVGLLFAHGHQVSVTAANQLKSGGRFLVDCPEYPFDHSNKYWAESRLSRDYRLRGAVQGEFLGVRASDWNPLEPRWRSFLSTETDPWLADHNVSGTVIYPAAGMVIMAMEAALQMVPANRTIAGYLVKESSFLNPIVVGQAWEDRTEVVVELRPLQSSSDKASTWSDVRIFSYRNKEEWSECFRSRIQVHYEEDASQADVRQERRLADKDALHRYQQAVEACDRPVDTQVFYHNAGDHGLQYGDWFQLLEDLHWDGKKTAVSRIDVSPSRFNTPSIVHPAVLDVALHMLRASSQAFGSTSRTNVPVQMTNAWFSAKGWQSPQTAALRCWGVAHVGQDAGEDGAIYALDDGGRLLMSVEHLVTVSVSDMEASGDLAATRLLHTAQWKPQLSLLNPAQLSQACIGDRVLQDDADAIAQQTELTSIMNLALSRALNQMTAADHDKVPATRERHIAWMKHHLSTLRPNEQDDPANPVTDEQLEKRLQGLEAVRPSWMLYTNIIRAVKTILVGEKDPLEIIYDAGLADRFYDDMFRQVCDVRLQNFLELASHENPGLRVLEVGAGTGGFTGQVLGGLQLLEQQGGGGLRLAEYTYTDISPMFFERARERWKSLDGRVSFKTLDLERSLESQGFEVGSYDLIVAGSVLHATEDMAGTLKNIRSALKPGGRTLILELVAPKDVAVNFTFGLVPGWWAAREEWRALSPLLTEEQWDASLRENGFSGNDLILGDSEDDEARVCSILISTATETPAQPAKEELGTLLLVVDEASETQTRMASLVRSQLDSLSDEYTISQVSHEAIGNSPPGSEDVVVSLANLDSPFMFEMSQERFVWLQGLLRHAKQLLWVSAASQDDPQLPLYDQAQGFFRSLRLEAADSHIVSLTIEQQQQSESADAAEVSSAQHVITVLQTAFLGKQDSSKELEYAVKDGLLQTCRVVEDIKGNAALNSLLYPQMHDDKSWAEGPPLALTTRALGTLDALCFTNDDIYETDLAAGEVEIEAKAWGVNFLDVSQALGRVGHEKSFGVDCAGIVTRVNGSHGDGSSSPVQVGDRVCMLSPGCMRRYPRAPSTSVIKIPSDDMSFANAASALVPGITAYYALVNVARISKGETVLIHSAAGATGQMAVAVAKMREAVVYATVGSEAKKRFLVDVLGIPEDHIFHSRNTSFAQGIKRVTGGRGVDVVLNSLSGDALRASFECMARCGRFLEIGKTDMVANSALPMSGFFKNVSFSGIDLREIIQEDPELTADLLHKTMQFVCDADAKPTPVQSFPASQVEQAFRTLQNGTNIGRIVIEPNATDIVPQYLVDRRLWRFESNASYLIAGGWGGIGRAIMLWMAERGARHLIAPSRSGAASKAARDVLAELQARGVQVIAPRCDVASESALSSMLEECARTMPPIKGCINAALALQDAMFDNMTLPQWQVAVKAKIDTAWNLHNLLPKDLSFFVLLSSLAGIIGQMATANYAGGCTFQDALARHRVQHGMKGVSLDIGWMRDIGIVSESAAFQRHRLTTDDMKQIDARSLMALLSICCDPEAPPISPEQSQMLIGLRTPADFLAKGRTPPALLDRPLFSIFSRVASTQAGSHAGQAADAAALFRTATEPADKAEVMVKALVAKLARAMDISPADVELSKPLSNYGVDSLMAVELRNWIKRDFSAPVAVFDIMGGLPISSIGELVVSRSTTGAA